VLNCVTSMADDLRLRKIPKFPQSDEIAQSIADLLIDSPRNSKCHPGNRETAVVFATEANGGIWIWGRSFRNIWNLDSRCQPAEKPAPRYFQCKLGDLIVEGKSSIRCGTSQEMVDLVSEKGIEAKSNVFTSPKALNLTATNWI
jgi:hypothetical protein